MAFETENLRATVNELFALYQAHGQEDYIGEPVSQLEHMWQAAALAAAAGYDDEVVLAAFFHDLGHLCAYQEEVPSMAGFGAVNHEKLGANYLQGLWLLGACSPAGGKPRAGQALPDLPRIPTTCASSPRPARPRWPSRAAR